VRCNGNKILRPRLAD